MNDVSLSTIAENYATSLLAAQSMGIKAEPEAQLTVPLSTFLTDFSAASGLGALTLVREAQLDGVRPDFAAAINKKQCGWVELKAPGHSLNGPKWRGREKTQWELLAELDSLIVSNGNAATLYFAGIEQCSAKLPVDGARGWDPRPLKDLLEKFVLATPTPIKRVSQLATRLAPLARFMRMRLDEGFANSTAAVIIAKEAWDNTVHETTTTEQFSSDVAQVVAYSMAIAGLGGQADINKDGTITLQEAKDTLALGSKNVLAAALGPILGIPELMEYLAPELGAIVRLVSSIDADAVARSKDSRGEPWLWFYEDFLEKYDPEARKQAGVYYTPTPVVNFQVRAIDHLLRTKFKKKLGFGDPSVTTLDPATGSGTYPIAVIDKAVEVALKRRGPAGPAQIADNLVKNIVAFELLPGPYSVAHLRIGQRIAQAKNQLAQFDSIRVYLTDTLEDPNVEGRGGFFGDAKILADAAQEARDVKKHQQVTVCLGNPPWDRVTSETGGWVTSGDANTKPLFDDVIKPAQEAGIIFSSQASLYDLYVYFWRWAMWKVFQNDPAEKSVISFITGSKWIEGEAFLGLRKLAVETSSEIWVLDLGGDGRGARKEENVFDIQTAAAIVTLVRTGKATKKATVRYKRIRGSRKEKYDALNQMESYDPSDDWQVIDAPNGEKFIPESDDEVWNSLPYVYDLFPWQQPGIKYNRAWPVAPSQEVLSRRWSELLSDDDCEERATKFVTSATGRNIHTRVGRLPRIADLSVNAPHQPLVRMGWRSFDIQWTFDDPRLAKTDSPALWQSISSQQVFMVSPRKARLSSGPAAVVSVGVPDLHYFNNRGGKDVIPLYRDAEATRPNITSGVLELLEVKLGFEVSPESLMAYVYAMIAHGGYTKKFNEQLETPGARVPMTAEPKLFQQAVELGSNLLWMQTYGQRFFDEERPQGQIPRTGNIGWLEPVTEIPATTKAIRHDSQEKILYIGNGSVSGVTDEMRSFEVSGLNVLDKWLGARTKKGIGRSSQASAKPLDLIRPEKWEDEWNDELLDLLNMLEQTLAFGKKQMELLEAIMDGELIGVDEFPLPTTAEQKVPPTIDREFGQETLGF